jgi:methyl-accepting chemotaxis protein
MKIKSIRTRLLLVLLPLIFVILSALSGVSYYFSEQALTKSVDDTARAVGTDYSKRIEAEMELLLAELNDLASVDFVRSGSDKARIIEAMRDMKTRLGVFGVMGFISPDGSGVTTAGTTTSYTERDYFKKVMATRKAVISEPTIAKTTGKLVVILAVPVIHNDQLTGVLIGNISLDRLTAMIKDLKFLDTGYGQIAHASGMVIAHSKQPELTGKLNLLERKINAELNLQQSELDDRLTTLFKTAAESDKQSRGLYNFVDGVEKVAVCTPIDLPGDQRWIMTVAVPVEEATREISKLAYTLFIISILCLIIAGISVAFIAKRFVKPIAIIKDECLFLSQGDLREREVEIHSKDEIGQLAKGFRDMRAHLHDLVTKVHSQSEQLAASSEELTANSEQSAQASNQVALSITEMAAGATAQTEAANEASSVVEQMSTGIQQIAANANQVADQSAQATQKAKIGDKAVEKAIIQMNQIENTVNTSAQVVAKLGERSKEIGQIVDTISGIAGQTNLLALNAAIEAARAGEQGKGFAVVAEEVRKLAEQSQEAAQKIAKLIGEIQGETDKAVVAMNEGTQEVKTGTEVVNAAGIAFREIMDVIDQVSDQVKEISAAIQQMAAGSQQIVGSVKKIDDFSKKSAGESQNVSAATEEQLASMEEIATSSQALAQLAQDLQTAVTKFRV